VIVPVESFIRDDCCWKSCKNSSSIILLGFGLCGKHYEMYIENGHQSASLTTLIKYFSPKIKKLIKEYNKEEK
tara:strand:- start:88 stop:306 length:219 start_codon:yes stop_codon:yes gene_type:complete